MKKVIMRAAAEEGEESRGEGEAENKFDYSNHDR